MCTFRALRTAQILRHWTSMAQKSPSSEWGALALCIKVFLFSNFTEKKAKAPHSLKGAHAPQQKAPFAKGDLPKTSKSPIFRKIEPKILTH